MPLARSVSLSQALVVVVVYVECLAVVACVLISITMITRAVVTAAAVAVVSV